MSLKEGVEVKRTDELSFQLLTFADVESKLAFGDTSSGAPMIVNERGETIRVAMYFDEGIKRWVVVIR